jgi:hypothetical protein
MSTDDPAAFETLAPAIAALLRAFTTPQCPTCSSAASPCPSPQILG